MTDRAATEKQLYALNGLGFLQLNVDAIEEARNKLTFNRERSIPNRPDAFELLAEMKRLGLWTPKVPR